MKVNKGVIALLVIAVGAVASLAFYWYEWRPAQIREECLRLAKVKPSSYYFGKITEKYLPEKYNEEVQSRYKLCLHEKGLE